MRFRLASVRGGGRLRRSERATEIYEGLRGRCVNRSSMALRAHGLGYVAQAPKANIGLLDRILAMPWKMPRG